MKKVIAFMAIIAACFASCTSTKENVKEISVSDYYKDNPYAQHYINDTFLITEPQAMIYAHAFKKHKYNRSFYREPLNPAWSTFNRFTIDSLLKDDETDSVYFLFGAYRRGDKSIPRKKKRHPFVILQGVPKIDSSKSGKGGKSFAEALSRPVYFRPKDICPPPNTGCRIPGF